MLINVSRAVQVTSWSPDHSGRSQISELGGGGYTQADGARHLVCHLPAPFPQLDLLGCGGVGDRACQNHLAHELVLQSIAVPHLDREGHEQATV